MDNKQKNLLSFWSPVMGTDIQCALIIQDKDYISELARLFVDENVDGSKMLMEQLKLLINNYGCNNEDNG